MKELAIFWLFTLLQAAAGTLSKGLNVLVELAKEIVEEEVAEDIRHMRDPECTCGDDPHHYQHRMYHHKEHNNNFDGRGTLQEDSDGEDSGDDDSYVEAEAEDEDEDDDDDELNDDDFSRIPPGFPASSFNGSMLP